MKYGMAANINQSEQGRREECKSDKKRKVFRDSRMGGGGRLGRCVEEGEH